MVPDDDAWRNYLESLRSPNGFVCVRCSDGVRTWRMPGGSWWCEGCSTRHSVTAGTLFRRTRTRLPCGLPPRGK